MPVESMQGPWVQVLFFEGGREPRSGGL
jgi:hypothetical protein